MKAYKVLRRHDGDKEYHPGDERIAKPADVQHLIDLGVLALVEENADAAPEPEAAPEDKAADPVAETKVEEADEKPKARAKK